jgi:hypothetical protein
VPNGRERRGWREKLPVRVYYVVTRQRPRRTVPTPLVQVRRRTATGADAGSRVSCSEESGGGTPTHQTRTHTTERKQAQAQVETGRSSHHFACSIRGHRNQAAVVHRRSGYVCAAPCPACGELRAGRRSTDQTLSLGHRERRLAHAQGPAGWKSAPAAAQDKRQGWKTKACTGVNKRYRYADA